MATSQTLAEKYTALRAQTCTLASPLSAEDYVVQSMPNASPTKWHLAHTTWFFETFVLKKHVADYTAYDARYQTLFNSYYKGVGAAFPRHLRGTISRPGVEAVYAYRRSVDEAMLSLLEKRGSEELHALVELGLNHEQQHQELLLTDIKHAFGLNPQEPVYREQKLKRSAALPKTKTLITGGMIEIGHSRYSKRFSFDNETPRHAQYTPDFRLHDQLVTCGDFQAFIDEGGYQRPSLWLDDGWTFLQEKKIDAPLYWRKRDDQWWVFTLHGVVPLDKNAPLVHVSLFEADAFAHFCGKRLPTEFEWEHAAQTVLHERSNMQDEGVFHPNTEGAREGELSQLTGQVWEWTQSAYAPYRGFEPLPGTLGEYSGKFMNGQNVLRGGSVATPASHYRPTYRNFFAPSTRFQFSGVRLAEDA